MEYVCSIQHVEVVADQNVIVHDVVLSSKKNACYVLLVNGILVTTTKKEHANVIHLLVIAIEPP